ncbi:MAG TPA: hypothetical protein VFE42_25060 [Chloroflexota bacterium]|nr:hypothetical protein [Chloroflexota bacterium]
MIDNSCWTDQQRARIIDEIAGDLWRYGGTLALDMQLADRLLANLFGLPEAALDLLRHRHLLLSDAVRSLLRDELPSILDSLRLTASYARREARSSVRGSIDWGATTRERVAQGGDRGLFVTVVPRPGYGSPETRLLLATLRALRRSARHLLARANGETEGTWQAAVSEMLLPIESALHHRCLAGIEAPEPVRASDLATCRRSPHASTAVLVQAHGLYHDLIAQRDPLALLRAMSERSVMPLDDSVLYEVWALLGALRVFEGSGWTIAAADLVGRSAVPFTLRSASGDLQARLRFDHTPRRWRAASVYRTLFNAYGVAGAMRRPDLIVEMSGQNGRRRDLLIEVKLTHDPQYIADSIYKVLGYLADFGPVLGRQDGPPVAILLVWDGITAGDGRVRGERLAIATHRDYCTWLERLIAATSRELRATGP